MLTPMQYSTMEARLPPDQDRKRIHITGGAGFVGSHLDDEVLVAGQNEDDSLQCKRPRLSEMEGDDEDELMDTDWASSAMGFERIRIGEYDITLWGLNSVKAPAEIQRTEGGSEE